MAEETSGREKVLEETAAHLCRLATLDRACADAYGDEGRSEFLQLAEDREAVAKMITALASPSTPEPALRGEVLEEAWNTWRATCLGEVDTRGAFEAGFAALASPSTQERGGKVEEIAQQCAVEIAMLFIEADGGKLAKPIAPIIASALRTHAGESAAQSERAGMERAAKWHDEQAKEYRERAKENCLPGPYAIAINHEAAAKALRSLSAARKAGGE